MWFKRCVVVLSGSPLRGKDYLAKEIKKRSNFEIIKLDKIREMLDPSRRNGGKRVLLPEDQEFPIMAATYGYMCTKARYLACAGYPVILPATFSRKEFKAPLLVLKEYLDTEKIPLKVFYLERPPDTVIKERIKKRLAEGDYSNITTIEQVRWAEKFFKKIDFTPVIDIDSTNQNYLNTFFNSVKDLLTTRSMINLSSMLYQNLPNKL